MMLQQAFINLEDCIKLVGRIAQALSVFIEREDETMCQDVAQRCFSPTVLTKTYKDRME